MATVIPSVLTDLVTQVFRDIPNNSYAMRAILAVLMFAVYWFAVSYIFVDKNDPKRFAGVRITIALVLAAITGIGIPDQFLTIIFGYGTGGGGIYGTTAGILLILAPPVILGWIGIKIYEKQKNAFGKILVMMIILLIIALLGVADAQLKETGAEGTLKGALAWIIIALVVTFAIMVGQLAGELRGKTGSSSPDGGHAGRGAVTGSSGSGSGLTGSGAVTTGPGIPDPKAAKKATNLINKLEKNVKEYWALIDKLKRLKASLPPPTP